MGVSVYKLNYISLDYRCEKQQKRHYLVHFEVDSPYSQFVQTELQIAVQHRVCDVKFTTKVTMCIRIRKSTATTSESNTCLYMKYNVVHIYI